MFQGSPYGYGLSVPHQMQISAPLSNGAQIHLSGTPNGSRFEVNLKSYSGDIVLHVNPRVDEHVLVLNNNQQGSWKTEERHSSSLRSGIRFTMVILVTDYSYKIAINNAHVCEFRHRSPMSNVQTVEIKGELSLESAQYYPGTMGNPMGFPQMHVEMPYVPSPPQVSFNTGGFNTNFSFPSMPSINPVPSFPTGGSGVPSISSCHIHVNSRIFIRGFIKPGARRFEINFLQGFNDSDDIAFHFNPRFDQNQIVKNHRRNGQWGSEENQPFPPYMPLVAGSPIDLQIACFPDKYAIFMNNQLIAEYSHKITPGAVKAIQYKGDITITSLGQL